VVPLLLWFLVWRPSVFRSAHWLAGGFVVGAAPWLVYNLQHDWTSLADGSIVLNAGLADHLVAIYRNGLPAILGLRAPWTQQWLLTPWLGRTVYVFLLGALMWMFARGRQKPTVKLLCVIALVYPLVLALSSQGGYESEPRYLFLLTPVLTLLIAAAVTSWTRELLTLALSILVFSSAAGLAFMADHNATAATVPDVQLPPDIRPLLHALEEHDIKHVYTHYWIAYLITFATDERIIGMQDDGNIRYAPYSCEGGGDTETSSSRARARGPPTSSPWTKAGSPTSACRREALSSTSRTRAQVQDRNRAAHAERHR
jgi:hypothetical protein